MLNFSKGLIGIKIIISIIKIKFFKKRIPLYCEWEITSRCNMKCSFCSTWVDNRNTKKDILKKEALTIIDQLAELGTKMIHFSGGEPTLRDDLSELISYAQSKGILVALTTNGSASNEIIKKISHADIIRVSIDGPEKFHDNVRRYPGAYNKAISTIQYLQYLKKSPQITSVFSLDSTYLNFVELSRMSKKLNTDIAINLLGINISLQNSEFSNIFSELAINYLDTIKKLKKMFGRIILNSEPIPMIIRYGGLDKFGCRAMDIALSIKSDGTVSFPCTGLTKKAINGKLKNAYYSNDAELFSRKQGSYPECRGCYIKCMCSASSLLKLSGFISIFTSNIKSLTLLKYNEKINEQ